MKRIIFHLPFKVLTEYPSASQLRPVKILEAFKKIGCEVDVVSGYGKERKEQIKKIKGRIREGVKYDFLYSESYNMPNLLSEPNHLPKYPFLDSGLFSFCKKNDISIGLFYRDVHWNFPHYRQNFGLKTLLMTYPFYIYDLFIYRKYVDIIYVPSVGMMNYVPVKIKAAIEALPPGIENKNLNNVALSKHENKSGLKVLYVGGIGNLYQIKSLFKAVSLVPEVELTVCCREGEWNAVKSTYSELLSDRIKIVHKKGEELIELYDWSDIASIFVKPIEYWKIVMPMKLFEYMRFLKPVLGVKGTAVGDFVNENNIGWSVEHDYKALAAIFTDLLKDSNLITDKQEQIKNIISNHTWEKRAEKVVQDLTSLK